jgi:hypothetical protein
MTTSGGSTQARVPLIQDNVFFDANSFDTASQTLTTSNIYIWGNNIDLSGINRAVTFNLTGYRSTTGYLGAVFVKGNWTGDSDITWTTVSSPPTAYFIGNNDSTVTNYKFFGIGIYRYGYTLYLGDNFANNGNMNYIAAYYGTLDTNNYNTTCNSTWVSGTYGFIYYRSGIHTFTWFGNGVSMNATYFDYGTSTITVTNTYGATTGFTFTNSPAFYNLTITSSATHFYLAGNFSVSNAFTLGSSFTGSGGKELRIAAGTTATFGGTVTLDGTASYQNKIRSNTSWF